MSEKAMDVFIDIDFTFFYPGKEDRNFPHGYKEFLNALNAIPANISFYSSGHEERNLRFAKDVVADACQGREAFSYKVFTAPRYSYGSSKKSLARFSVDLGQSILIDDNPNVAEEGEERNILLVYAWVAEEFNKQSVLDWKPPLPDTYAGKVYEARMNNSLVRVLGLILQCLDDSKAEGCTVVEALHALQWKGGRGYRHRDTNSKEIYERGLAAMKVFNSELELLLEEQLPGVFIYPWHDQDLQSLQVFCKENWYHTKFNDKMRECYDFEESLAYGFVAACNTFKMVEARDSGPLDLVTVKRACGCEAVFPGGTSSSLVLRTLKAQHSEGALFDSEGEKVSEENNSALDGVYTWKDQESLTLKRGADDAAPAEDVEGTKKQKIELKV